MPWKSDAGGGGGDFSLSPNDFPPIQNNQKKGFFDMYNDEIERIARAQRYLVMKRDAKGHEDMTAVSPFLIARTMRSYGDVNNMSRLKDGTLLVETKSKEQANRMMNIKRIGNFDISVTEHPTLNKSKGIIHCWDLAYMDEQELLTELSSQMVTEIRQIKRKPTELEKRASQNREGNEASQWKNTGTFAVTFALPEVPTYIKAGYLRIDVKPFVPNPLRCFNCQKFGHMKTTCKGAAMCGSCAQKDHYPEPCAGGPRCINCGGDHESWSRRCPVFRTEFEIQKIRVYNKISFAEAKKRFIAKMSMEDNTFAGVTGKRETSFGVNCEHCLCQCNRKPKKVVQDPEAANPQKTQTEVQDEIEAEGAVGGVEEVSSTYDTTNEEESSEEMDFNVEEQSHVLEDTTVTNIKDVDDYQVVSKQNKKRQKNTSSSEETDSNRVKAGLVEKTKTGKNKRKKLAVLPSDSYISSVAHKPGVTHHEKTVDEATIRRVIGVD
ncbi:uncharacterized protein LOC129801010 [Phlebotomus papatasi]|uniref:uncharacterized protein LOC129801010 n=1 Tax=Phlebotomus papatasi TaxID=29031 RepID=UPI0024833D4C|nr:uncharacterized protein LOC129801010 [Phlebotomus papatasi]